MNAPRQYSFRKVLHDDLELLLTWQANPHVKEWWDGPEPGSRKELDDPRVARWIVEFGGHPFAYMQDYTVHGWADHHFFDLPRGSRGIDQFIGEPDMIGSGHGPAFIKARLHALFAAGVPVVATDPDPGNARAIAAYEKAGFRAFGAAQDTRWGRILPMKVAAP